VGQPRARLPRPAQANKVTPALLRTFIIQTRKKVKPGTVKLVVALLSSLYSDLIESEHAVVNPCRGLAKKTRALLRSDHDPKNTPYLTRWPT